MRKEERGAFEAQKRDNLLLKQYFAKQISKSAYDHQKP